MVAEFLKAEVNSDRFSLTILDLLAQTGIDKNILLNPNLKDPIENNYRRQLLTKYRGYQQNSLIFDHFPNDIKWFDATISKDELGKVMYINWDYWLDVSNGTRLPKFVAQKIKDGKLPEDKEIMRFKTIANAMRLGIKVPRLILIAKDEKAKLVVLEGHARITAFLLIPETLPNDIEVIIGLSKKLTDYNLY